MTPVNWERLDGQIVEELVGALIVLADARSNHITASRGDRGIDIREWTDHGFNIYQVKRYTRPLTSRQASEIEESWRVFVAEGAPSLRIASWTLVTPWDPSNERREWLERLTSDSEIATHWMGRTQLDVLAAQNPRVVDYYLGDGARQWQELMASAIAGAKEPPSGAGGQALLDAISGRHEALADALNEVDPFYRYEIEVVAGGISRNWQPTARDNAAACVLFRQVNDERTIITRVFARSALSSVLRPITQSINFDVSSSVEARDTIERFRRF